jgi:hypothetical protein
MACGDTIAAAALGNPAVPEDTDATANALAEGATVSISAQPSDSSGSAATLSLS